MYLWFELVPHPLVIYHHSRQDSYSEQNGKNVLNAQNAIFAYFSTFSLSFFVSQEVDTHLLSQQKFFATLQL